MTYKKHIKIQNKLESNQLFKLPHQLNTRPHSSNPMISSRRIYYSKS